MTPELAPKANSRSTALNPAREVRVEAPLEGPIEGAVTGAWREVLRQAIRDPELLIDRLGLPETLREAAQRAAKLFPLVVPEPFLARMRRGDPNDPLLLQVLPIAAENAPQPAGFSADPVGELEVVQAGGLLQKYHGRALLITSGVCAVACRYCFRRHFPYAESPGGLEPWEAAFELLEASPDVDEVILSGGDPLMRSDRWLGELVARLEQIRHLKRLRIHTRLPIVIPSRVDAALLGWLSTTRLAPVVVVHVNHPQEIDADCAAALKRLVLAGIPVLNQAVLLKGVNDSVATLEALSRALLEQRVMPYYLHQLDPVAGASHFEVPVETGLQLIEGLRVKLPGFGVPRYVREVCGATHKVELGPSGL